MADEPRTDPLQEIMESDEWKAMTPLQRRMTYESVCSAQAAPDWVRENEAAQAAGRRLAKTKEYKDVLARGEAERRATFKRIKAVRDNLAREIEEIMGEDYVEEEHYPKEYDRLLELLYPGREDRG